MLQCTSDIEPNHAQCLTSLHVSLHLLKHCNEKEIRRDASLQFCTMYHVHVDLSMKWASANIVTNRLHAAKYMQDDAQ